MCSRACAARTASPSCAVGKGSPRASTTAGRRSSWKPARSGFRGIPPARRPRARSRTCAARGVTSRKRLPNRCGRTGCSARRSPGSRTRACHARQRARLSLGPHTGGRGTSCEQPPGPGTCTGWRALKHGRRRKRASSSFCAALAAASSSSRQVFNCVGVTQSSAVTLLCVAPGSDSRATDCSLYSGKNRRLICFVISSLQVGI